MKIESILTITLGLLLITEYSYQEYLLVEIGDDTNDHHHHDHELVPNDENDTIGGDGAMIKANTKGIS